MRKTNNLLIREGGTKKSSREEPQKTKSSFNSSEYRDKKRIATKEKI